MSRAACSRRRPASFRVNQLSAEIFETQNRYSEAAAEYRKAIAKSPQTVNLHFRLGRAILLESHEPEALVQAQKEFEAELALNPGDAAAEFQIGQILNVSGKTPEAGAHFQKALDLSPDFAEAALALGKMRIQARQYAEAIPLLEHVVAVQPANEGAPLQPDAGLPQFRPDGQGAARAAGARKTTASARRRVHGLPEETRRKDACQMRVAAIAVLALAVAAAQAPRFRDIAKEAGLTDSFPNGGDKTKEYIIETTGSGVAFVDYDNDGFLDIFVASGQGGTNRMYHNDGNGHFTDVTAELGLTSSGWGQGVCAGDYDNDGYTDLFVTYWGQNRLYRNVDGKRFEDVTAKTHLTQDRTRYNTGCAFLDYDGDGHLDLFVANYLKFDFETTPKPGANPYCFYRGMPVNCGPRGLPFDTNLLYHNKGDGTFEDVSERSGIAKVTGHYALSVLAQDVNDDGRPDIYVACDQTPSLLFMNQGDGTFVEEGVPRGVAYDENGRSLSGMGITSADYDGDGRLDIFRTNFSDERETLYRNTGDGQFDDVTTAAGLGQNTRFVNWGCAFFDFDNDGWKDLLLVSGHVFPGDRPSGHRHPVPRSGDSLPQHGQRHVSGHFERRGRRDREPPLFARPRRRRHR